MAFVFLLPVSGASATLPLTVCVAENNPPLSYQAGGEARGLDVRVAQAIADELERPLKLIPFESKYESDSSLSQEVNALLSSGVCELASGFPLPWGASPRCSPHSLWASCVRLSPPATCRPRCPMVALSVVWPHDAMIAVLSDPFDDDRVLQLQHQSGGACTFAIAAPEDIRAFLQHWEQGSSALDALDDDTQAVAGSARMETLSFATVAEAGSRASMLVNSTLLDAHRAGASDVCRTRVERTSGSSAGMRKRPLRSCGRVRSNKRRRQR